MPEFAKRRSAENIAAHALVDPKKTLTWAEVDTALNCCANKILTTKLGPRRRVAVFAENSAETALAHLGALLGGASSVPVNFHLTSEEASYILSDSESQIVFVDEATAERGIKAAASAGIDTLVGWGFGKIEGVYSWDEWLTEAPDTDPPSEIVPRPNLLYTSGTTGRPKGTELPPTNFAGGSDMDEHLAELKKSVFADFGRHLVPGPMYHTGPLGGVRMLAAGIPVVVLGRFDAETTLAAINRYRIESVLMVPTHFVRLLALPEEVRSRYDISSLKLVAHTGAKCPVEVMREMIDWFGPVFRDLYGATEVGTVCSISSHEWLKHPGSVGQAQPPFSPAVLSDDMNELPYGTEGKLFFRDATERGIIYPNDPEMTAATNPEPGLFTLGEIGYVNSEGYVFITDRFSDMVVSGGVNVYPAEAEQRLIEHPQVADTGCIGIPHAEMGEELKALIVAEDPNSPPDLDHLSAWLRQRLSHYKCPRSYELVASLGRSAMGKINKRELRASYLDGTIKR